MSIAQDRQAMLVNALIRATNNGRVSWESFDESVVCYVSAINGKMVYISEYHEKGTDSVKIEIYKNGALAEAFLDDDLSSTEIVPAIHGNWFLAMTDLLEKIKRLVSDADETLEELLRDLDS